MMRLSVFQKVEIFKPEIPRFELDKADAESECYLQSPIYIEPYFRNMNAI